MKAAAGRGSRQAAGGGSRPARSDGIAVGKSPESRFFTIGEPGIPLLLSAGFIYYTHLTNMKTIQQQAAELLQQCEVVVLTSVDEEGYPRPVPMSKIQAEGVSTVWMATGNDALKTKDFSANPKAGLCFFEKGNSVALTGEVEIVRDNALKEKYWQDWLIAHFTGGPADPNYVLLKFKGDRATLWIDGKFVHTSRLE